MPCDTAVDGWAGFDAPLTVGAGPGSSLRLAELVGALSLATDLGMGQPMDHALRTCVLAVQTGRQLGLADTVLSDLFYLTLLRFVGCTADAHEEAAAAGGDDLAFRRAVAVVVMGEVREVFGFMLRRLAEDQPPLRRARLVAKAMADGPKGAKRQLALHCEIARMLAARIGVGPSVAGDIAHVFERWDGKGMPGVLSGADIPVTARIAAAARDVEVFAGLGGWEAAEQTLRERRASAYDPDVADALLHIGRSAVADLDDADAWTAMLAIEPDPHETVPDHRLEDVLRAFADFADLKSPFTRGHSGEVAELAAAAGEACGIAAGAIRDLHRAALVHDLGRTGVANGVWDKPGPLTADEWERVRLHPYLTERILRRCPPLDALAGAASAHHERIDGSGYHRGSGGTHLDPAARILAAADAYQAMTQPRPHRPALSAAAAVEQLRLEASQGRIDGKAAEAVLEAAGHAPARRRVGTWPRGLTDREVDVLRLACRGQRNREVASALGIAPKTVGRHLENIYAKAGVSTRAGLAVFAMEHLLLGE